MDLNPIITAIIALGIIGTVLFLLSTGKPIPELLSNLTFGVFGYYFGRGTRTAPKPDGDDETSEPPPKRRTRSQP